MRDGWYVEKQLEEARVCAGDPPFEIVPYIMTRITDLEKMLSLLRSKREIKAVLDVKDEIIPENNFTKSPRADLKAASKKAFALQISRFIFKDDIFRDIEMLFLA
jgi:hypothetical protein